jgi:hypothetical protein
MQGPVDEGLHYFHIMSSCFSIFATVEHYACMVDLLGCAGHLQEAEHLIMRMSCEPNTAVWMALLGACKSHGNVEMGECVAKQATQIGPGNAFYRRQQVSDPKMPCEPNADLWMVLLGACRSHHNVERGQHVAKQALVGGGFLSLSKGRMCEHYEFDDVCKVASELTGCLLPTVR